MDEYINLSKLCGPIDRAMSDGYDREHAEEAAEMAATSQDIHELGLEMSAYDS